VGRVTVLGTGAKLAGKIDCDILRRPNLLMTRLHSTAGFLEVHKEIQGLPEGRK
jgi:hypothetical protein